MLTVATIAPGDLAWLCEAVRRTTAIQLDERKEYLIQSRLEPLVARLHLDSVGALLTHVRGTRDAALLDEIVDALTTNETSWLRDVHPWKPLVDELLPDIVARVGSTRPVRVWSAACSTGQEPYTLAILLREHFGPGADCVEILATDFSPTALAQARAGRYSQVEMNRGLPAKLLVRHFQQDATHWIVNPEVRRNLRFQRLNLAQPLPRLPRMDIVLLRNVLIYFDVATKQAILERVAQVLAPDGWLLLGSTEMVVDPAGAWRPVTVGSTTFYQLSGAERPTRTPEPTLTNSRRT